MPKTQNANELLTQFDFLSDRMRRNGAVRFIRNAKKALDDAANFMVQAEELVGKEVYLELLAEHFPSDDPAPLLATQDATGQQLPRCPVIEQTIPPVESEWFEVVAV